MAAFAGGGLYAALALSLGEADLGVGGLVDGAAGEQKQRQRGSTDGRVGWRLPKNDGGGSTEANLRFAPSLLRGADGRPKPDGKADAVFR